MEKRLNKNIFDPISNEEIKGLIESYSQKYDIDINLILAIVKKESAFNVLASRAERDYKYLFNVGYFAGLNKTTIYTEQCLQSKSWGLMQIMGGVARELGHRTSMFELLIPELNLDYGCKHFSKFLKKLGTQENAISAYNQGSPRRNADGKFKNQKYVDDVLRFKKEFEALK